MKRTNPEASQDVDSYVDYVECKSLISLYIIMQTMWLFKGVESALYTPS